MKKISIVGIDLAKHVFQLHAVDAQGHPVFSKTVRRDQLRLELAQLPPCLVAMERVVAPTTGSERSALWDMMPSCCRPNASSRSCQGTGTMPGMPPVLPKPQRDRPPHASQLRPRLSRRYRLSIAFAHESLESARPWATNCVDCWVSLA